MPRSAELSAVLRLLQTVWDAANTATGHSWERLNHALRDALRLAIAAGFPFTLEDFRGLAKFNVQHWIGASTEWCYALAIAQGNSSAAVAYEEWQGREPLIADDVTPSPFHRGWAHQVGTRQQERLHVGATFCWQGERVTVTSFKDKAAVACVYHTDDGDRRKIKKRFTITREAILSDRAERKERSGLIQQLLTICQDKVLAVRVRKALGVKTQADLDRLPLAKLRVVAAKFRRN